jgi:hypothetical protein
MDEGKRIALVEAYHFAHGCDHPRPKLHAAIHTVVENQLALGEAAVVETFHRLQREGLTRHDAVHAIGSIVVDFMVEAFKSKVSGNTTPAERYLNRVRRLSADEWRRSG